MNIKTIASRIRQMNRDIEVPTRLHLVHGTNASGKSTILDTIELAATNKLHGRAVNFHGLSYKESSLIEAGFKFDGKWFTRQWIKGEDKFGKPSIKSELKLSGAKLDTAKNAAEYMLATWFNPSRFLDIQWFAGETSTSRRKILLDLLAAGKQIDRPISEWVFDQCDESEVEKGDLDTIDIQLREVETKVEADQLPLDKLRAFEYYFTERIREGAKSIELLEGELAGLTIEDSEIDTSTIPEMESRLKALNESIAKLSREIGKAEESVSQKERIDRNLAKAIEDEKSYKALVKDVSAFEKRKAELETKAQAKSREIGTATQKAQEAGLNMQRALRLIEDYKKQIAAIQNAGGCCVLSKEIKCPAGTKTIIDEIDILIAAQRREAETAKADHKKFLDSSEKLQIDLNEIRSTIKSCSNSITASKSAQASAKAATESRIRFEAEVADFKPAENIDSQRTNLKAQEAKRDGLQIDIQEAKVLKSKASRKATVESQLAVDRLNHRCSTFLKKKVGPKGLQGTILEEMIGPFTRYVAEGLHLFDPAKDFYLTFEDARGNANCEFGFADEDGPRAWEDTSRSERVILATIIAIALMRQEETANFRVITIDDIEGLKPEFRLALCRILVQALDNNWIDNAFIGGLLKEEDVLPLLDDPAIGKALSVTSL